MTRGKGKPTLYSVACTTPGCEALTQTYTKPSNGVKCYRCDGTRVALTTLQEWAKLGRFFLENSE